MRLTVAAVGRLKQGPERELLNRYRERASAAGRTLGLRPVDIAEIDESRARERASRTRDETARITAAISGCDVFVLLDSSGETLTSEQLAEKIGRWRDRACAGLAFVIGGPDGHGEFARRPDLVLSFGRATWPHQLVRIMLLEQIYRAVTILAGHPYHRE